MLCVSSKELAKQFEEPEEVELLEKELADKAKQAPSVFSEAMALRAGNYWPTESRRELIESAIDSLSENGAVDLRGMGVALYKILSLEDHHVIAAITTIQLNPSFPRFGTIKPTDGPDEPEIIPFMAAGILGAMLKLHGASLTHLSALRRGSPSRRWPL